MFQVLSDVKNLSPKYTDSWALPWVNWFLGSELDPGLETRPEWFLSSVRLGKCHHPPNGAGALSPERLGWGVVVQVLPPFPKQCPGCVVHALQELRFLHFWNEQGWALTTSVLLLLFLAGSRGVKNIVGEEPSWPWEMGDSKGSPSHARCYLEDKQMWTVKEKEKPTHTKERERWGKTSRIPFQNIILQGKGLASIETCRPVKQILPHSTQSEYVLPSASKGGRLI